MSQRRSAGTEVANWQIVWITTAMVATVNLSAYRVLEDATFLPVVCAFALLHILLVGTYQPRLGPHLFISQTLLVAASVVAVFAHVSWILGPLPPHTWSIVLQLLGSELRSGNLYFQLGLYLVGFLTVVSTLLFVRFGRRVLEVASVDLVLVCAYVASAVNVTVDYALRRPGYHMGGDNDAVLFAAGLLGVEFSILLHILVLGSCLWRYISLRRASS